MEINRRTVLFGLGAAGFGTAGVLIGSGAFTSVEAERTVSVNITDDDNAVLRLEAVGDVGDEILDTESAGSGAVTQITFEHSTLNQHAMTLFEDALRVTNEGSQDVGFSVDASGSDDPNDLVGNALDIRKDGATIVDSGSGANAVDLDAGTSILLTIVIDLLNGNQGSDLSSINTVAVAARERDHSTS